MTIRLIKDIPNARNQKLLIKKAATI